MYGIPALFLTRVCDYRECVRAMLPRVSLDRANSGDRLPLQTSITKSHGCTCKAGQGAMCKHLVGALLHVNRNGADELTCTDLEQAWGKDPAKGAQEEYKKPVRIREYCHVNTEVKMFRYSNEVQQENLDALLTCTPRSALATFTRGREVSMNLMPLFDRTRNINQDLPGTSAASKSNIIDKEQYASVEDIFANIEGINKILSALDKLKLEKTNFYWQHVWMDKEECVLTYYNTLNQNNANWKAKRKYRVTGSTCYRLFTHSANKCPDWLKKVKKFLNPISFSNAHIQYGLEQEEAARRCYEVHTESKILKCGLVVHPREPWLAYSPDGVTSKYNVLIEVKCPVLGQNSSAVDFIYKLPFIDTTNNVYCVKKKHMCYGQIQLGMFILNIRRCHFVVYASFDNTCIIIEEEYDEDFVLDMVLTLKKTYFEHMLPLFDSN